MKKILFTLILFCALNSLEAQNFKQNLKDTLIYMSFCNCLIHAKNDTTVYYDKKAVQYLLFLSKFHGRKDAETIYRRIK